MELGILALNLVCALALWFNRTRPDRFRVTATIVFAQALFYAMGEIEDAFAYHATAASFDLVTIYALSRVSRSRISFDIQVITFISLVVNSVGYIAYELYVPSIAYEFALFCVLTVQVFRLFKTTRHDDRESEDYALWDLVCRLGLLGDQSGTCQPSGTTEKNRPTGARK